MSNTITIGTTKQKALIIGCGIAGPVLAMFLKRPGIDAVIYEVRPDPRDEAGSFLGLAPNGRDVLDTLGTNDEIDALSVPTPRIAFLNHKGKQLGKLTQPMVTFKRGLLNKGLHEAAARRGIPVEA